MGRNKQLFVGGNGGLRSTAVMLSVTANAKRHGINMCAAPQGDAVGEGFEARAVAVG